MKGKLSTKKIVEEILKLQAEEFLGVCKILGVRLVYEGEDRERDFSEIWADVIDKVDKLNKTQRKNLAKLLRVANKDR